MCNTVVVGAPADSDTIPADLLWGADGRGEPSLYHFGVSAVLETSWAQMAPGNSPACPQKRGLKSLL